MSTSLLSNGNPFSFKETPLPPIGNETDEVGEHNYSNRLSNVEAQRIMTVLQESTKKVDILSMIPNELDEEARSLLGNDLANSIQVHFQINQEFKTLENRYELAYTQSNSNTSNKNTVREGLYRMN